ncbi:MAG: peptidoglycan editing factor PgeF [Zoogloeaceae bacterium]|jgi:YfiH family protein|nr:peptidoglycan editing factor PgeF [Zoogloeaceae bacterium]
MTETAAFAAPFGVAPQFIYPDWPAPQTVGSVQTTRMGGVSIQAYASFNLGEHVGDAPEAVRRNRALLQCLLPAAPVWLEQTHGAQVVELSETLRLANAAPPRADAAVCRAPGLACAIMTADCLPVLFCDIRGEVVAAAHAGWRGLLAEVLENTVAAMRLAPERLLVWFGPAIGPNAFVVGEEVRAAFLAGNPAADAAFRQAAPHEAQDGTVKKYYANLYHLARQRLHALGVTRIFGGDFCTCLDAARFFSWRRERQTGRMASLIWISGDRGQKTED